MTAPVPTIFSPARRLAIRRRMRAMQFQGDEARFLLEDMVDDVVERLAFLRHVPARVLLIGEWSGTLAPQLPPACEVVSVHPEEGFDEEAPFPVGGFDLIASFGTFDTVNDLPGALIHLRAALSPGGLMIASFPGAGSLPTLREAMLAADGERPAAHMHPMVDVRAGGQLMTRCGYASPVVDSRPLSVSYRSFGQLLRDLRAQGLSRALASPVPRLSRDKAALAATTFMGGAERRTEEFEILTLSGFRK
ncbi:methyltransferase domain-containing protein [Aurantiacibacter suaedae]|uniref:methyltransferase domain-containing protein n=1 Tax=Aurantiacibacter suaedae TaxID=2545755 RepID=UPI001F4F93F0|nr:methyltransferase domain-containing protein [Aurantiacibacter suaedae]